MIRLFILFLISAFLGCSEKDIKKEPIQNTPVQITPQTIVTPKKPEVQPQDPDVVQPKPIVQQTPRDLLITAATNGDVSALNAVIKGGLKLRDNNNGIDALKAAQAPVVRDRIVDILFDEFQPSYKKGSEDIGGALREALDTDKVAYGEFIDELIKKRRTKVGDAKLLRELAYESEVFQKLKAMGVDLNQVVEAYGLEGNDAGPLIVSMTSIGANPDTEGTVKIKIAQALLDAGADINAKDLKGHTALHYAENDAKVGHDWQRKGFIALAKFLKTHGALNI